MPPINIRLYHVCSEEGDLRNSFSCRFDFFPSLIYHILAHKPYPSFYINCLVSLTFIITFFLDKIFLTKILQIISSDVIKGQVKPQANWHEDLNLNAIYRDPIYPGRILDILYQKICKNIFRRH